MSWSLIEQYRKHEQEYDRARRDYEQAESQYHAAAAKNPKDPALQVQYAGLVEQKKKLDQLYHELTSLRDSLAQATEAGSGQAAL